jgi:uncharacterized membrane protein
MPSFLDIFLGVPQSKYAGIAILVSLAAVGLAILFGKEKVSITQKLVVVGLLFLLSLPAMLVTLFQLTCIVTGAGFKNKNWWCGGYAWLVSALIIVYSVLLIVMTVLSFTAEAESKEVEKFYSRRENFQDMTKEYFEGEENVQNPPAPGVPTMPGTQPVPPVMTPEEEVPMTGVSMVPTNGSVVPITEVPVVNGGMPGSEVSAVSTTEMFSGSCGAPYN